MNIVKSYKKVQKAIKTLDKYLSVFERIWETLEDSIVELQNARKELIEFHKQENKELTDRHRMEKEELKQKQNFEEIEITRNLEIAKQQKTRVEKVLGKK